MKSEVLRKFVTIIGVLIATGNGLDGRSLNPGQKSTGKRLEFRTVMMGEMIDEEGTKAGFRTVWSSVAHFGFTLFEASNGRKLTAMDGEFRSPEEAKRYFDWKVARSSKVIRQGTMRDSKGKSVGYRAEVLLAPDQKQLAVMLTSGVMFQEITADSLADALEFEKRGKH